MRNMNQHAIGLFLAAMVASVCGLICRSDGAPRRNLLLIVGDDIGIDSLALFNDDAGATFPPTPTLDGLAERGVTFTKAYACPTCSPTRAAMLTGRYSYRTGVFSPSSNQLHADEYTLPEVLADNPQLGYRVASVG